MEHHARTRLINGEEFAFVERVCVHHVERCELFVQFHTKNPLLDITINRKENGMTETVGLGSQQTESKKRKKQQGAP